MLPYRGYDKAEISGARVEIERLKLLLAKVRREHYGQSSERGAKIIAQLELQLAELEETAAQEDAAGEIAAAVGGTPSQRARSPARRPLHFRRSWRLMAGVLQTQKCDPPHRPLVPFPFRLSQIASGRVRLGARKAQTAAMSRPHHSVRWATMSVNVRFRQAQDSDVLDLACLIDSASRGLALWLWSTLREPGQSTIEAGAIASAR